jgi:cytochrome c
LIWNKVSPGPRQEDRTVRQAMRWRLEEQQHFGETMNRIHLMSAWFVAAALMFCAHDAFSQSVDADAAQALIKKNDCGKCHAVDKKKDGPSYKETATRLKGKAGAEDEIVKHLTTSPKVKIDGKEEEHKAVKSKDEAEVRNLARWILTR